MIVKMVELYQDNNISSYSENASPRRNYSLREVFINPEHIISFREDLITSKKMESGLLQLELDSRQEFTKLHLVDGNMTRNITVIGSPIAVADKLNTKLQLLKG